MTAPAPSKRARREKQERSEQIEEDSEAPRGRQRVEKRANGRSRARDGKQTEDGVRSLEPLPGEESADHRTKGRRGAEENREAPRPRSATIDPWQHENPPAAAQRSTGGGLSVEVEPASATSDGVSVEDDNPLWAGKEPPLEGKSKRKRLPPHAGFIFSPRIGIQHCIGVVCSKQRHHALPGPRLDLFLGRNVGGLFDVGITGGWGMMFAPRSVGSNALELYGVSLDRFDAFARIASPLFRFDARELTVLSAKLSSMRMGAHLRVHINPRGRFVGYVGTGVAYTLFRGDYGTPVGPVRVDLHGFDIPFEGGVAIHVHRNVAVGLEGSFFWSHYLAAAVTHPAQKSVAPLSLLQASIIGPETNLRQELPDTWTLGILVRVRI